jgi:hypothetical protein
MNRNGWKKVSRVLPCSGCGKPDWCTVAPDGTACKCRRAISNHPVQEKDGSTSWMHPVNGADVKVAQSLAKAIETPPRTRTEWETIYRRYRTAMTKGLLRRTAEELGVTEKSLNDLEICRDIGCDGWKGSGDACFPMRDSSRKVIGMRIRYPDAWIKSGRKRYGCVRGSSNGLFIPASFDVESLADVDRAGFGYSKVLLLPEGPTDVAAARSLGFMAIGRPSCNGGAMMLCALIRNLPCAIESIIVADRDYTHFLRDGTPYWPGWEGALSLANQLQDVPGTRKVISLKQVSDAKDIRQWLQEGGQAAVFQAIVRGAVTVTPEWVERQRLILKSEKTKRMRKAG